MDWSAGCCAELDENTVVVFTADHGEMLGERGLWYKMSFFEDSARVPLIVAGPEVARARVAEAVSLLDLAPTLAELAAVDTSGTELEGSSLVGVLRGSGPAPGRAVCEYLAEGVTAPAVMLRRGRFKYVCEGHDPERLYDLGSDPRELHDLRRRSRPRGRAGRVPARAGGGLGSRGARPRCAGGSEAAASGGGGARAGCLHPVGLSAAGGCLPPIRALGRRRSPASVPTPNPRAPRTPA